MSLYRLCVGLHFLALTLWLGHMFVWSLIIGPALKRIQPPESAEMLRERSLFRGGLGWPALAVLIPTGLYMLAHRGIGIGELFSGAAFQGPMGMALAVKLLLVLFMIAYQLVVGHKRAPLAIYFNMLAAACLVAASVILVRGWV
ncbi:MAG: hypothetical protein ABI885_02850 [Gammaproteobacteria bacterium]